MFRFLEQLNLGIKIKRLLTDDEIQRLAIAFVDDVDFFHKWSIFYNKHAANNELLHNTLQGYRRKSVTK